MGTIKTTEKETLKPSFAAFLQTLKRNDSFIVTTFARVDHFPINSVSSSVVDPFSISQGNGGGEREGRPIILANFH